MLLQSVQNCLVKCSINGLTHRNKYLMDDAFIVEEGDQQCFDVEFLQTTLFLVGGKSVNTTPSISVLILYQTDSTRSHPQWWCFPEVMDPDHTWKWSLQKFPSILLPAHTVCELVRPKQAADLPLTQIIMDDGVCHVLANDQFLCSQS